MSSKILSVLLILIFLSSSSYSAGKGSVRGTVVDSANGETIAYVTVVVKGTKIGTVTNTKGYFYIPALEKGKTTLIFSYMGYETKEVEVQLFEDQITKINVELSQASVQLKELSVYGERKNKDYENDLGLEKITPRQIELQPQGIESDIFRVIQNTAGVTSTGDVTSRYYVRGGGSDQNLLQLDGMTIYNPYHALGIFSVIDPDMISVMEFYKGGFPSEIGGRLSSVVNIISRDGNRNKYAASVNASFISGKVNVEGPIPNGSFIFTGRKSYFTSILKKYLNNKEAPFDFYDASFKINWSNPQWENSKFLFQTFLSRDGIYNDDPLKEDYYAANRLYGFNWYKIWSSPLFSDFSASVSQYDAQVFPNLSTTKARKNIVVDGSINADFTYVYDSKDEMRFGVQSHIIRTQLDMENLYGTKTDYDKRGSQVRGYINYKFWRYEDVALDIGIRMNLMSISQKGPFFIEPRINFKYKPIPTLSLKASFGRNSQELASLTSENEVISLFEPWVVVPSYLNPPEATHVNLGAELFLTENLSVEVEGYYKILSNLMDVNTRKYTSLDYDYINVDGRAYGMESEIKYQNSFLSLQASYSLSKSEKLKDKQIIIPRYDIRNIITLMGTVEFGKDWSASANWSFNSGMPFTPIAGFYDRLGGSTLDEYIPVTLWANSNNARLPYYHRLDLSLRKMFNIKIVKITIGASIINVYDRKNIFYFQKDTGEKVYMLPFLPSLTFKAEI